VKYAPLEGDGHPDRVAQLTALLKSCGGFEALLRQETSSQLRSERVVAFLLLDREFPRAMLFCLENGLARLTELSGATGQPQRMLGRLCSELVFSDPRDVLIAPLRTTLEPLLARIDMVGMDIAATYFNTQAIGVASVAVAAAAQQQQ
jgi:uncharacterized alpha-E superfamily protein